MTHEQLQDRLLDLAYGELGPRDAREVEKHALRCETCRAELARMRETRRLMSALPAEPAPEAGERILLAAAREAVRRREPRRAFPRWLFGGAVAAASLAMVVVVSYRIAGMRSGSTEREERALMSDSPYARAPESGPPATAADAPREPSDAAKRAAPAPERVAVPSRRDRGGARPPPGGAPEREQRYAAAPPAPAPQEAERRRQRAPAGDAASGRAADAAPSAAAEPAPDRRGEAREEQAAAPREEKHESYGVLRSGRAEEDAGRAAADESHVARAPPAAESASPPRAAASAAPPRSKAAAPAPSRAAERVDAEDPLARYEALRAAGRLRAEERTFPGCERELWRRVERDPDGRVVSYAWDERVGTRRVRLEAIYGPDGALARKRAFDPETSAREIVKFMVPRASEVDVDAPPRCDR